MEPSAAITAPSCGRWSRRSGDTRHLPWPRDDLAFGPVLRDECLGGHSLHSEPWGEPVSPWASPDLQFLFLKKGKEERKDLSKTQSSPKIPQNHDYKILPKIPFTKSQKHPQNYKKNEQNLTSNDTRFLGPWLGDKPGDRADWHVHLLGNPSLGKFLPCCIGGWAASGIVLQILLQISLLWNKFSGDGSARL